jgi:hypothetical protein
MWELLNSIEHSGFPTWVRESPSVFAFPTVLLLHTIGMGVVVGIIGGIDLRILGLAPALPLAPMERYYPVAWAGFWTNAVTGTILVMQDATTVFSSWDFYVKMTFIALAVINVVVLKKRVFADPLIDKMPQSTNTKILAVTSIFFWLGAITAGRLMAYVGPVAGLQK